MAKVQFKDQGNSVIKTGNKIKHKEQKKITLTAHWKETIWGLREGTQGLNAQGRGRQSDTGETHRGEAITHTNQTIKQNVLFCLIKNVLGDIKGTTTLILSFKLNMKTIN